MFLGTCLLTACQPNVLSTGNTGGGPLWPTSGTAVGGSRSSTARTTARGNQSTALGTTSTVVDVTTGNFGSTSFNGTNTTYYFAPGTYSPSGQITTGVNDWYIGEYSAGTNTTINFNYTTYYGFSSPDTPSDPQINDTFEYFT